jgi:hypothetical protein
VTGHEADEAAPHRAWLVMRNGGRRKVGQVDEEEAITPLPVIHSSL